MAVDDFLSRDTEALVLPSKSYYPLHIPIAHYQLRHFISSPEQDLLYYASDHDLYCLNSATKIQVHITKLPWEARCTASGHGYVCVGGADDGNFAAIKATGFPPADSADVDALLPIELRNRTSIPRPPLFGAPHTVRLEKIGEDIVNSISIHKYPAEGDAEDEVVAVLTNNDKTVRIYSLTQEIELTVLDLPFPMNHATISPDGELLLAVGDSPVAFFFQLPKPSKSSSRKTQNAKRPLANWHKLEQVPLYLPPGTSTVQGYFTTAWSPSGQLCAVGSECGYITVFDVELLRKSENGEDAIVHLISSTRPDTIHGPGSVRTMQFSPAPWDLLIWSEDQARVCVADIRAGFKVRQVLHLDPKEEDLERVDIADFEVTLSPEMQDLRREADFIRRYRRALDSEGTAAAVNYASDYIEASSERRRLHRQLGVVESDNDPHGLTAHERQILETLRRTTRQREEDREQLNIPRSINYTSESTGPRRSRTNWFSTLALASEVRDTDRDSAARRRMGDRLTEFMIEGVRNHRLQDQDQRQRSSWRRPSIIFSNEGGTSSSITTTTTATEVNNITDAATTRSPNPIPAHARRADVQTFASTDDAWRRVEEALASNSRAAESLRISDSPDLRSDLRHLRQLTQARERPRTARESTLDPFYSLPGGYRRASRTNQHDPELGVRTAGLAMSQDGRTLYCGTENGIFEFQINLHQRRGSPAIMPC